MNKKNSMYLCGFRRGSHGRKFSQLNFSSISTPAADESDSDAVSTGNYKGDHIILLYRGKCIAKYMYV